MKLKMDFFCSSPASTAICSTNYKSQNTIDQRQKSHHHHNKTLHVPCSSHFPPIIPKPYNFEKSRKSYSKTSDYNGHEIRRKSSADIHDLKTTSCDDSSTTYILRDSPFIDNWLNESNKQYVNNHPLVSDKCVKYNRSYSSNDVSASLKSSSFTRSRHQVVVLRVSLHCKGCEGKVRKHLSKMEGVTSFSIERETQKVTVIGDITPVGVLSSVSKVKYAQLWHSPTSSSSSSLSS